MIKFCHDIIIYDIIRKVVLGLLGPSCIADSKFSLNFGVIIANICTNKYGSVQCILGYLNLEQYN